MRKIFMLLSAFLLFSYPAHAQFGKNNTRYNQLDHFYESYRFDVWHNLDTGDPVQMEYLRQVVANLENARDWMSGPQVFNHPIQKRIPVFLYKTHTDMESSNLVGGFLPEGVGAFVESDRKRMVLKADFSGPLGRAIGVHELAHEFQFDIYNPNLIRRAVNGYNLPNGYFEGCAEYIAGLYDPHTRDDIRRREQRMYASNPRLLPTWPALHYGADNPYTMWSMVPEFLEDKYSFGTKFCTEPLKNNGRLGEFVYDMTKGELGNPDLNSEKFDQQNRHYWGTEQGFEVERIKRPKPYEENQNFKGRTITPYGHPQPMLSPILSPNGTAIAAFTIKNNGVSLVRYNIPQQSVYLSKEDREKIKKEASVSKASMGFSDMVNLTPQLPPVPWEYIVVQGFETWKFNGFDVSWSHDGKMIAFFARINRDHALVIVDAENGDVLRKIELPFDQAFSPSFNADDHWVYFSASKNTQRDIYAVYLGEPDVERLIQVTNDSRFDTAPVVSPDGSKVVYVGSDGDFQHLFAYDVKADTIEQLTFGRFNDSSPSWSDDGSTIVYTSDEADSVWNLYTLDLTTKTVKHWTDFMGGVETPLFARGSLDTVYYVSFRDDDQFLSFIYPNYEVFEARLKQPIREYRVDDVYDSRRQESTSFLFNPNRDLVRFELDSNQLLNPKPPSEKWKCGGGSISLGVSTYWGMFGQSFMGCSNILETKQHLGIFASYGSFKLFDYSYTNREKRTAWSFGGHQYQLPLYYQFYDIVHRYPQQIILNNTWMKETSFDFGAEYPINKFNRWEVFSKLRHRSYNVFGAKVGDLDENLLLSEPDIFTEKDIEMFRFMKESNGSNLVFGGAYVRDTILGSGNTGISGIPAPFHGNALRVQVESAPPLGEEFQGYTSASVQARTYRHLGSSSVFAARVELMASTKANGDFLLMGGPERLRGVNYGSISGNKIGYGSAELRFPFPGTYILYQNIRGFLFADGAISGFNNQSLPTQRLKTYGFGAQYLIPVIGMPAQSVWTRNNGKWDPTFYITLTW
jgi:hypothetical protein